MCTENVKEKTELLYALINGRKLAELPKINQVSFSAIKLEFYFPIIGIMSFMPII